jgi:EAL and modified HD-GYP domain-containing signal transduction protein
MFSWLARLIGRRPPPVVAAPAGGWAVRPPPAGASAAATAADVHGFGVRRALVGRSGSVAGFELLLPPVAVQRLAADRDSAAAAAHHIALLAAAAPLAAEQRPALLRIPARLLARPAVAAAAAPGTMLWLDSLADLTPEMATALRSRGVRLGVPDGPPSGAAAIDFVVLQASAGGIDTLLLSAQRWRERWPRLTVVALGLAHVDDIERALRGGVNFAGGQIGRAAGPAPVRELGAAAHRICELLNHLALDRDTAAIGEAVRADVALAYRLLRYVNSPAIGLSRSVETVEQAVIVLGRAELYRWLSVQLLSSATARQATRALQECALARGKLLEAVACQRGDADPGAHFVLGMLSLIGQLLQLPLAAALEPLRLGEPVRLALLHRQGPWAERVELVDAIDAGDSPRIEALAASLGVAEGLPVLVEEAWRWAALVTGSGGGERAEAGV